MYNPLSSHAAEFIDHDEVLETLDEAARECKNRSRVEAILEKAGPGTKAGAICFSLPISSVVGLRAREEKDPETD